MGTNTTDITNTSFQLASDFVNYTNASVFLTGKAGTGKTTFLKHVKENGIKNTVVVAPTGVAAINAGGTTIHSFFQLPFTPFIPVSKGYGTNDAITDKHSLVGRLRLTNDRKEVMQKLELLIIDEISMVRCDVLDAIDTVLRHVRSQYSVPFGGVQVLLIGDMYQLPPVVKAEEWDLLSPYYKSEYFFNSHVIEAQQPVYIELDKIYRQNDSAFVQVLNQVRNNEMDQDCYQLLHTRYLPGFNPAREEKYITLTTHNSKADAINFKALHELDGKEYRFDAAIEGEFYEKSFPADLNLKLKIGTQVMFLKNDIEKVRRYFNGKIGIVDKIEDDKIFVQCQGEPTPIEVKKEKWRNIRYNIDKTTNQIEENEIGSFTQFPLRLAWAITIHKSQGLTFEKAIIDAGEAFAPGQVYVALSRCTTLAGMILHSRINNHSLRNDRRIAEFASAQRTSAAQLQLLQQAKHLFQEQILLQLFDFEEQQLHAKALFHFINSQIAVFNKEAVSWADMIKSAIANMESTATKFQPQLKELLNYPTLPEHNETLQKRIAAASNHFYAELDNCLQQINKCIAVTDSKVVAMDGNKMLADLYQSLYFRKHLLAVCKDGFIVSGYLHQKRTFVKPYLPVNFYAGKSSYQKNDSPHPDLHKQLRAKRDKLCDQKNVAVFMVANSNTLDEMARYLPQTFEELTMISGFGKVKTQQFGEAFLAIINAYCEENNLHTNIEAIPVKAKRKVKTMEVKTDTKTASFRLFKEGKTIAEIAAERNLAVGTIEGHLAYFVELGEVDVSGLLSTTKQDLINEAVSKHGTEGHKKIMENLPAGISYGEVKIMLASLKKGQPV
ncbi:helix-turn-helix domain-containing protein [Ferruginibacter paludis]|uniref:helix-turn-helix domain-containing protein n=1 Tax=Ferruginibacter paludis TaxID=1310417 RepID=UPI0025B45406|nr:helix-turn-helix domain-containing protein [Ferruginibacter paludis]MDN3659520.1 helix-turn-helix domain-containing protein [Ferruginibacter paludis]